jgi:PAS domain S-box-containing protein
MARSSGGRSARLSRAAFEAIAESIPHIVWLSGPDGATDYFNELGTEYTGLPRQANYGWGWVELVHPEDAERARLGWEHATRTATPFELTYRIRRSDGMHRWHAFRALPVRSAEGEILRWIGTADDLEQVCAHEDDEVRVDRQTHQLRALMEAINAPAAARGLGLDARYRARRVNEVLQAADRPAEALRADPAGLLPRLSPREVAVLRLLAVGCTNAEVANFLGISLRSVEAARAGVRRTLGVQSRADLVRFALDAGLTDAKGWPGKDLR